MLSLLACASASLAGLNVVVGMPSAGLKKFNLVIWFVGRCPLWTDIRFFAIKNALFRNDVGFGWAAELKEFDGSN